MVVQQRLEWAWLAYGTLLSRLIGSKRFQCTVHIVFSVHLSDGQLICHVYSTKRAMYPVHAFGNAIQSQFTTAESSIFAAFPFLLIQPKTPRKTTTEMPHTHLMSLIMSWPLPFNICKFLRCFILRLKDLKLSNHLLQFAEVWFLTILVPIEKLSWIQNDIHLIERGEEEDVFADGRGAGREIRIKEQAVLPSSFLFL